MINFFVGNIGNGVPDANFICANIVQKARMLPNSSDIMPIIIFSDPIKKDPIPNILSTCGSNMTRTAGINIGNINAPIPRNNKYFLNELS